MTGSVPSADSRRQLQCRQLLNNRQLLHQSPKSMIKTVVQRGTGPADNRPWGFTLEGSLPPLWLGHLPLTTKPGLDRILRRSLCTWPSLEGSSSTCSGMTKARQVNVQVCITSVSRRRRFSARATLEPLSAQQTPTQGHHRAPMT